MLLLVKPLTHGVAEEGEIIVCNLSEHVIRHLTAGAVPACVRSRLNSLPASSAASQTSLTTIFRWSELIWI